MKTIARELWMVLIAFFLLTANALAQPGLVDFTFNAGASVDFEVFQVGLQSNGKIIVGGGFGSPSPGLARLNADGSSDASFNAVGAGVGPGFDYAEGVTHIYAVAVQPDDKVIIGGVFSSYNGVGRTNLARINADGTLDLSFDPGQSTANSIIPNVLVVCVQPDGKILVGGEFSNIEGTGRLGIARLNANGSLDTSFNPGNGVTGGSLNGVYSLALQPDGKVLVGGDFTAINGSNAVRIARLNTNGSVDTTFNAGAGAANTVLSIAVQTNDNKILLGGNFMTFNNTNHIRLVRLNADGSLDAGFNAAASANQAVNSILALSNGQILLGGSFTTVNSTNRNRIARLNGDGSLDLGFNPGTGATSPGNPPLVNSLALQANGQVILGGFFTLFNNVARNFIARVNTNGSLDTGFNPGGTLDAVVNAVTRQPDGKFIIGGSFTNINQTARNRIARLNSSGSLDAGFDPGTGADSANATVNAVALQSDGSVLLGGSFTTFNGLGHIALARLNQNGGLDNGYNPILSPGGAHVNALAVESGDRLLIGGTFTLVNGISRTGIARLNSDGSLDTSFNPGTGASGVQTILVETNGKIVIGGAFTTYNGTSRSHLAGINDDGSVDTNFNVGAGLNSGSPTTVDTLTLQPDGKVLIGGNFETYNGLAAQCVARLNTDGSLDTNYNTRNLNSAGFAVYSMALQPDGKLLLGGNFPQIDSTNRNYIARLNTNASLDTTFNPGSGGMAPLTPYVYSIALQTNGEVVIGGGFTTMNNSGRWYVARLHGDAPEFNPTGSTNGGLALQWTAIPGRTYRVQFATNSISTNWSNLPPDILAVTNLASTTDPVTNQQRFYRVALLPLP